MPRSTHRTRSAAASLRPAVAPVGVACALAILVLAPAAARAQRGPGQEAPTNLQVLPKDWTRQQVMQVMRSFTAALGARCSDCHVEDDDASDAKPMKEQARSMMRMTMSINDDHLAALPGRGEPNVRVTCIPLVAVAEGLAGGQAQAALRVLEVSLELNPRSAATLFGLARLADTAGEKDKAIDYYRRGLEIQPGHAQAERRLRELTGGA